MTTASHLSGGNFQLGDLEVPRLGYGAMQLAGPTGFGPPADRDEAIAVLREAVELGIRHVDTADFYGPHITNELIREALWPYPEDLHLVTKIGPSRDENGGWPPARSPEQLRQAVHDNLDHLRLDVLDVVNLRMGGPERPVPGSIAPEFETLVTLQQEGLVRHIGLSTVDAEQIAEAQAIAPIVCVQNLYNLTAREDDHLVDSLASQDIAFVPWFPLGGMSAEQSDILARIAAHLDTHPRAVALAWLLHRSPNILLIPGTSSRDHLRANVAAAAIELDDATIAELNVLSDAVAVVRRR